MRELGRRTDFERDYTAILYSHAFRRLRFKTQVFYFPVNDHVCTRLDHSLYVASTSSIICRNLQDKGIEVDPVLASAIGLGHDLGHSPFGHAGETVLNKLASDIGGFKHEKHGLRIVDKIEKPQDSGPIVGLNLTLAVRDGIANHNGESKKTDISPSPVPSMEDVGSTDTNPCTVEGCVVRLVDKVSYLGRDIEDAIILKFIREDDLPGSIRARIGTKDGEIVDFFVKDIISSSSNTAVKLSESASADMEAMVKFNYERIYKATTIKNYIDRISEMLKILFNKLLEFINQYQDDISGYSNNDLRVVKFLGEFINKRRLLYFSENNPSETNYLHMRIVVDFIATLTDRFAFDAFSELFLPRPF